MFYMVHYLAGGAILYSPDPGPKDGDPGDLWGKEVRKLDLHPQKGSDSACPPEGAVGPVLQSQQACGLLSWLPAGVIFNPKTALEPKAPETAYQDPWLQVLPIDHQIPGPGVS